MRLSLEQGGIVLCAESDWESRLLAEDELKRKLAYTVGTDGGWQIDCLGQTFSVEYSRKQIFLPKELSRQAYCYALRIIADGLALDCGYIPFHAAAVSCGQLQILLFAQPGAGKSHFAQYICGIFDNFQQIGDDHIILSDSIIRGNQICRLRDRYGQEHFTTSSQICSYGTDRIGFLLHPAPEPGSVMAVPRLMAFQELRKASALKYLLNNPVFHGREHNLNQVFGRDKMAQYERAIVHGVPRLGALYLVSGPIPYIECILQQKMREQLM